MECGVFRDKGVLVKVDAVGVLAKVFCDVFAEGCWRAGTVGCDCGSPTLLLTEEIVR